METINTYNLAFDDKPPALLADIRAADRRQVKMPRRLAARHDEATSAKRALFGTGSMQPGGEFQGRENPYRAPWASLDEPTAAEVPRRDLKPFRTIWTRPRETVRWLVAVNPQLHVVLLVSLSGIGETLDRASMRNAGDRMPVAAIIGVACVLGPLAALLSLWIGSHLIRLTGKWIGGIAPRQHIRTAIAWAAVPSVFALPLWIPELLLFGSDMFTEATPRLDAQPLLLIPILAFLLVEMILGIWAFVLLCNTVAEVQGFRSAWRGLGNLLLAGAIVFVPLMVLACGVFLFALP